MVVYGMLKRLIIRKRGGMEFSGEAVCVVTIYGVVGSGSFKVL